MQHTAEVVEAIAGNTNGTAATATQINLIDGVSGAVEARDYTAGLQNGTYVDSSNPTAAEIQAVVDAVNATILPANISITDDSLDSYVVSIYDTDYNVDIPGVIDNSTEQITIDIPYTVTDGESVNLAAYSSTANLSSAHSEETEDSVVLTFAYPAQTGLSGTGTFTGTITVDDTNGVNDDTYNTKKLDIDDDNNITLATFDYATDDAGTLGTYTITVLSGVLDRMYGVSDNASNTESHKFIYIPIVSPDTGKIWLNNNLGAEYADATNPNGNFNPVAQATAVGDYLAYGSLFQWGRSPDGHELMTRTNATTATAVYGTTSTNDDNPGHSLFISAASGKFDWRVTSDDTLWASESSANNVCPVGWRIPSQAELAAETTGATTNTVTNYTKAQSNFLKITPAGYRNNSDGSMSYVGSYGRYWTSEVSGDRARLLEMTSGRAYFTTRYRANAFSVRCVKD